jgi:hypothetical protein
MSSGEVDQDRVPSHPYLAMLDELDQVREKYADVLAWTMTPNQLVEAIPRLAVHQNVLATAGLAMLREADRHQVGDPNGFANTAGWLAKMTRSNKLVAHRQVALAKQLDEDAHVATREACGRGEVSIEQAAVIMRAVEALPKDLVDPAVKSQAEELLVGFAAEHDPKNLGFLGHRVLEYIAADIAEEAERRVLEADERNAAASAFFEMHPDGHGSVLGRFKIPVLAGAMLEKHLNAIAAPKHQAANGVTKPEERIARPMRLGAAFVEYLETRDAKGMPKAGGVPATVVVTMSLESLLGVNQAATLDSGERISAAEARRLACEAGIIPVVLGGKSQPLDVGRKRRFHTEAQRIAIGLRDQGCSTEDCDWPPGMCHIHHDEQSWGNGGGTSVRKGRMFCPRHHTLAHDSRYQMKTTKNGKVTFSRRT